MKDVKLTPSQQRALKNCVIKEKEIAKYEDSEQRRIAKNRIKDQKLILQQDIYSVTFVTLLKVNNPVIHRQLEMKCFLTFFLQMLLVGLIVSEFSREDIFTGDVKLNACRYLCSICLHVSIMPEFSASFDMMRFSVNN